MRIAGNGLNGWAAQSDQPFKNKQERYSRNIV